MRSEGNTKNYEPAVDLSFTTMLQHTGRFWVKDFLSKNNVTTLQHPPYSSGLAAADFLLVLSTEISIEGTVLL